MDLLQKVQRFTRFRKQSVGMQRPLVKKDLEAVEFTENDETRLKYYLGDLYNQPQTIGLPIHRFRTEPQYNVPLLVNFEQLVPELFLDRIHAEYAFPLVHSLSLLPDAYESKSFLTVFGDMPYKAHQKGIIAQARQLGDEKVVLHKFLPARFWNNAWSVKDLDIPYKEKKDQIVWRGATTNSQSKTIQTRFECVSQYFENDSFADIGFSNIVHERKHCSPMLKPRLTVAEQLPNKFLLALEGNDVASSLAWMLCADSVVMMAKPTVTSWLMEDQLVPWVHYLPLDSDFSNLEAQYDWALSNEEACLEISRNASAYVGQFMQGHKEVLLECEVMRRYLDNVTFEVED